MLELYIDTWFRESGCFIVTYQIKGKNMCYRTLLLLQMRVFSVFELHQHFLRVTVPSSLLPLQPSLLMIPRHPLILIPALADYLISWMELVQQLYYSLCSFNWCENRESFIFWWGFLFRFWFFHWLLFLSKPGVKHQKIYIFHAWNIHILIIQQINLLRFEFFFVVVIWNIMYR